MVAKSMPDVPLEQHAFTLDLRGALPTGAPGVGHDVVGPGRSLAECKVRPADAAGRLSTWLKANESAEIS